MQRKLALGLFFAVLLFRIPALASAAWTNAGMLILRNEYLAQADANSDSGTLFLKRTPMLEQALQNLAQAAALDANNFAAQWARGRAALALGDATAATKILDPLASYRYKNALLYQDLLSAFNYTKPDQTIALYEASPSFQLSRVVSDTVALAYLDRAQFATREKTDALLRARTLRPSDLYVNYHLWTCATAAGNEEEAAAYRTALTHFSLDAVHPANDRVLLYTSQAIPALWDQRIWDRSQVLNVVAFLVWQHSQALGVEKLLDQLSRQHPTEPEWWFYLGELYQRRGNLDAAEAMYQRTLSADGNYVLAYQRLGMLAESEYSSSRSKEALEEAAAWYEQYHKMAPDDPLGLKRLVSVDTALQRPDTARLEQELAAKTDGQRIAASLLGIPEKDVSLGPNLVENGEFRDWRRSAPVGWRLGTYLGTAEEQGLYYGGVDSLVPDGRAARIITLWGGPMPDGTTTCAEYIRKDLPSAEQKYLISILYSFSGASGSGLLFIGDYSRADGFRLIEHLLPSTDGQARVAYFVGDGAALPIQLTFLLRNWGIGDLRIWRVDVRQISMRTPPSGR